MSITCVCHVDIKASPEQCLRAVADFDSWPKWARDIERVLPAAAPDEGGSDTRRITVVVAMLGEEHDATLDLDVDAANRAIELSLIESTQLSSFSGQLEFVPAGVGCRMNVELYATLHRPLGPRLSRMAARRIETALSRDLVRYVQRGR